MLVATYSACSLTYAIFLILPVCKEEASVKSIKHASSTSIWNMQHITWRCTLLSLNLIVLRHFLFDCVDHQHSPPHSRDLRPILKYIARDTAMKY